MSRIILSALLVFALVASFAAVTKADVTGSFQIDITLEPMGAQTEAVKFFIDLQANLVVNVTLSGITFGADIGFGNTGVEFAVLSLKTNLGALAVDDTFVFAEPFGCFDFPATAVAAPGHGTGSGSDSGDVTGQCGGTSVFPIGDSNQDGVVDRAVGFVKKRISLTLNIAGITLENLALFEDVDFPDIQGGTDHDHDHFGPGGIYYVGSFNSLVDDQTPTFGFGDVITISGQTVSGITVTGSTGICASGTNYIKKRNWPYEVNKACTSQFGNVIDTPLEGGAKTPLLFETEELHIEGIELGGVTFDIWTTFKPLSPIATTITATFSILDLADVVATFSSSNITNLSLDEIVFEITSGQLALSLTDIGGDLTIDSAVATLSVVLNPNQNAADLTITIETDSEGLSSASVSLGISRANISLDTTTTFSGDGTGSLAWSSTSFTVAVDGGGGISFAADFSYTPSGMGPTTISLSIEF